MDQRDREQVMRAIQGDQKAYGMLIDAYQGMVFGVALNITGNYSDSEDIVQESFLRAYQKLRTLTDPSRFASWLYTLAKRIAYESLKKKHLIAAVPDETGQMERVQSDAESPAEAYARKQLSERLWLEVGQLPAQDPRSDYAFLHGRIFDPASSGVSGYQRGSHEESARFRPRAVA